MLGYPIGATLAPIVIGPILTAHPTESNETLQFEYSNVAFNSSIISTTRQTHSRTDIAFSVIGAFTFFWSVPILIYHFMRPIRRYAIWAETIQSYKEVFNLRSCSHGVPCAGSMLTALLSFFFVVYGGLYGVSTVFIFAYALDSDIGFTAKEAAMLEFSIDGSGVLGLTSVAFLSRCLSIQVVGFSILTLNTIATLCLASWAHNYKISFWILTCLSRMSFLPLWGVLLSWFGQYVIPSSIILALFFVSVYIGMMFLVWIAGYVYEVYTPVGMLYVAAACSVAMLITMLAFHFTGRIFKSRQSMVIYPKIPPCDVYTNGQLGDHSVEKTIGVDVGDRR